MRMRLAYSLGGGISSGTAPIHPKIARLLAHLMPEDTYQPIYIAANPEQAHILKNELIERGIPASVSNEALQFAVGDVPWGVPTAPRVLVHKDHVEEARQIALEFEENGRLTLVARDNGRKTDRGSVFLNAVLYVSGCVLVVYFAIRLSAGTELEWMAPLTVVVLWWGTIFGLGLRRIQHNRSLPIISLDDIDDDETEEVGDWPACPHCNRPRLTSCPVCETAGTRFPRAYMPADVSEDDGEDEPADKLRVICSTCDEPFTPVFPARCEWCGHRFRDGRELPEPDHYTSPFEEMNPRVWLVLALLVGMVGGTIALFASIASK